MNIHKYRRSSKSRPYILSKTLSKLLVFLLLIFISFSVFCNDIQKAELGAFDYSPFYHEGDTGIEGLAVELSDELMRRLGIESSYKMYPLKRALVKMEEGSIDGMMCLIKTPEREKYLKYSIPVLKVRGLIWYSADRKDGEVEVNKLEDLKSYKIGVTSGYSYGKEFDDILKSVKVDKANKDYLNYKKLMAHRIDIFPGNEIVAKDLFKRHPELNGKFTYSDNYFVEWTLFMTVSRKSFLIDKIPDINKILSSMKMNGYIDNLISVYID